MSWKVVLPQINQVAIPVWARVEKYRPGGLQQEGMLRDAHGIFTNILDGRDPFLQPCMHIVCHRIKYTIRLFNHQEEGEDK